MNFILSVLENEALEYTSGWTTSNINIQIDFVGSFNWMGKNYRDIKKEET